MAQDYTAKIRAMQAKAEDPATTPEERNLYLEKISELMVKYAIDEALLSAQPNEVSDKIVYEQFECGGLKTYRWEFIFLGCCIAEALKVKGLYVTTWKSGKKDYKLGLVGFSKDVEKVVFLWNALVTQSMLFLNDHVAQDMSKAEWAHYTGMQKYTYRRSFYTHFSKRIKQRLVTLYRKEAETHSDASQALVLVDRSKLVDAWASDNIALSSMKARSISWAGAAGGEAAANKANIGQGAFRNGGSRQLPR
jgi:uncharacterized protein DUF2786